MKHFIVLLLFAVLLNYTASAQHSINAYQADAYVGKNVNVTGKVINVTHKPGTKTISVGLSFFRSKQQVLTVIVHENRFSGSYYRSLLSLKGTSIMVSGKVERHNGETVINHYGNNMNVSTVEYINCNLPAPSPPIATVTAKSAAQHVGDRVFLSDTLYSYNIVGDSIFLDLGKRYPGARIIVAARRMGFNKPDALLGKAVDVRGMVVMNDNQLKMVSNDMQFK